MSELFASPLAELERRGISPPDVTMSPAGGKGLALDEFGRIPSSVLNVLPWQIDIDPVLYKSVTGTWAISMNTSQWKAGAMESSAQNDDISWDVVLAAGTWTVEVLYRKLTNGGIISVHLDNVEKGTIDTYAAAAAFNQRASATGIVVSSSGKATLKFKMATKHASSTGYVAYISHVQLRRTA